MEIDRQVRTCIIVLDDGTVIQRSRDGHIVTDYIIHRGDVYR